MSIAIATDLDQNLAYYSLAVYINIFLDIRPHLYVKHSACGYKVEKHHPEGGNVRCTLHTNRKTVMVQKILGKYSKKATYKNKKNKKMTQTVVR